MTERKRPRRPFEGGYARGEETRLRIIEAAIDLFGEYGFDGASTRDIAARAGVNAPALQYYFENKQGVYRACAEHIADSAWESLVPVVNHARHVLDANAKADALIDAFIGIQEAIADRIFMTPCQPHRRLFFAREQVGSEPAVGAEILHQRVRQPLNSVATELIARITGGALDDPVTLIRTFSLYGQVMPFHMVPRSTLALLRWEQIDEEKSGLIKATLRDQTRALLQMWHAQQ
jgi:TetR/AcrR family transcriptional regulator, regulator of cefoperazone and chloramphenicol sensitivity